MRQPRNIYDRSPKLPESGEAIGVDQVSQAGQKRARRYRTWKDVLSRETDYRTLLGIWGEALKALYSHSYFTRMSRVPPSTS
jgi:hypothetical protein